MRKKLLRNAIFGFGAQLIILILGLIVPRIMITNYGSDVNGVLSTVSQIFIYMALLEAGIGQAAKNLLYKPLLEKNEKEVSRIFCISQNYYKKVTIFYFLGVLLMSIIIPIFIKSGLSYFTIAAIIFFQGAGGALSFYYIETKTVLLGVDGKSYINSTINLVNQLFSNISKIILALLENNIIFIQFVYFIITIFKVLFYERYFYKNYRWIDTKVKVNNEKLKDRNSFILTEFAWTVFSSTDMIVLSIFLSTKLSSVYAVYNMVFVSINTLLLAVYNNVNYILGNMYHKDRNKYRKLHDCANSIFMSILTVLMICCCTLTVSFVKLYTTNVNDVNYIYYELPLLFCLVQLLSWSRYVGGNLIAVAGRVKKAIPINLLEALINLVLSVIMVNYFGIVGVLIATVAALPLKVVYCNYVADKIIMKRSMINTCKILITNYILFFIGIYVFKNITANNYIEFISSGFLVFIISFVFVTMINLFINKDMFKLIKELLKKGELK